jgi:hypothetical protein
MGTFGKSFSREIGKNTGKWVSNKVFGDGHATPHKIIHARQREKARNEREEARNFREHQKQLERDRREREKEIAQYNKEMAEREKQRMIEANNQEVHEHNNYIKVIQSVHKDYSTQMNWEELLNREEPEYVKTSKELEDEITKFTNNYIDQQIELAKSNAKLSLARLIIGKLYTQKYGWMFKIASNQTFFTIIGLLCLIGVVYAMSLDGFLKYFMLYISAVVFLGVYLIKLGASDYQIGIELEKTLDYLQSNRQNCLEENLVLQDEAHKQYLLEKEDYKKMIDIAKGVINKNPQSYTYALNFFNPFEDLKDYGSDISFNVNESIITVDFYVHSEEVIPNSTKKILRNGLEVKEEPLPTSRFNEIYQDYVCSCILRIAKEIFQLIPSIEKIKVNAKGSIMNSSTGNFEEKTIVSVNINKQKLNELNFDLLDPSDSMANFNCNMLFSKNEGFKPVEELQVA